MKKYFLKLWFMFGGLFFLILLVDQETGIFIFGIIIVFLIYVIFIDLPKKLAQEEEKK